MEKTELKQPLFLCGMMGSGKTTIGKILADKLGVDFHDLDSLIIEEAGMSIPKIFEHRGEEYFRNLEESILIQKSQLISGIMALGGGSLQNQRIVDHLKIYGRLIFLNVPKSVILERIAGDSNRPMLAYNNESKNQLEKRIEMLLEQRLPLYNQAQITINAKNESPHEVADKIFKKIKVNDGFYRR